MSGPAKRTLVIPLTGVKSNPGLANAFANNCTFNIHCKQTNTLSTYRPLINSWPE